MLNKSLRNGFTIVELVIVIVIIAILAVLVAFNLSNIKSKGIDQEHKSKVVTIMNALEKYYDTNGEYPTNSQLNPDKAVPTTNFTNISSVLKTTKTSDFTASDGGKFISFCISSTDSSCPAYSTTLWNNVYANSFIYISRFDNTTPGSYSWININQTSSFSQGWGCGLKTYYDKPGFVLAWRNSENGVWNFYRSNHGDIDISNFSGGPVNPDQKCEFSYP